MKLLLFYNPRSGAGAAARAADELDAALRPLGHECAMVEASRASAGEALRAPLGWADALVVIGGDGTVHSVLGECLDGDRPIYHVPFGTENLFARQFGMDRRPSTLVRAVEAWNVREVDAPRCDGAPFGIMCSVGPDASVIHRLARSRRGAITHLSYLRPILEEARSPALHPIEVRVDGVPLTLPAPGWAVVANLRQYATRIDPISWADPSDGVLDVIFMPARSTARMLVWMAACRARWARHMPGCVSARGREIEIYGNGRLPPLQIDGEPGEPAHPEPTAQGAGPIRFSLNHQRLKVLQPPPA